MNRVHPETLLQVEDLHLSFGANAVLRGVDLAIVRGQLLGLVGPNGSGKTSLIRAVTGLLPVAPGQVRIAGIDLAVDPLAARRQFGFAPDPTRLPPALSGRQALSVAAAARGLDTTPASTLELAERLGASRWIDQRIETYSLGTRQKYAILIGLIGDPPLLVLDEVMNGLDPISSHELKLELIERCERRHCGVLLATHGLEIAPTLLTDAALLHEGRIRHRWGSVELGHWRHADPGAFERAVVAALRSDPAG
ncbi:MAG: ABC transporter ATP-binding protein [Rhodanobacteraceae bacterium]|nr:ABC transporter ATP-binding protein [Rhodanobacteraceae bacterium]